MAGVGELGSTLYDGIIRVARERFGIPLKGLSPTVPSHSAVIGDISTQVVAAAKARYPLQTYQKVDAVRERGKALPGRLYPAWMFDDFIDAIIEDFIREHQPFSSAGEVVYSRPIVGKAGKRQKTIEYRLQKFGSCTITDRSTVRGPRGTAVSVVRTMTYVAPQEPEGQRRAPGPPSPPSARSPRSGTGGPSGSVPPLGSPANFPSLRPSRGGRR